MAQVKKTLFSIAFVAASGAYVVTAGHLFGRVNEATEATATDTALPAAVLLPTKPNASTSSLISPPEVALPNTDQSDAQRAPSQATAPQIVAQENSLPVVAPVMETPKRVAQAVPPMPRPRPAPPAPTAIRPAASTNTAETGSMSGYVDGTYTGGDENAYYGRVQVQVTVTNHQVASVKVLDYPQDRRTSRYINSQALPVLRQEVVAAQSANIDTVSGATLTSEAYIKSLGRALAQAGGAHA